MASYIIGVSRFIFRIYSHHWIRYHIDSYRYGCNSNMTKKHIVAIFKALGDENRIRILRLLHSGESAPASC